MKKFLSKFENLTPEELSKNPLLSSFIIKTFPEFGYFSLYNKTTGLFARIPFKGHKDPLWSPLGPEIVDISVTQHCSGSCPMCYCNAKPDNKHITMENLDLAISQLKETPCHAAALGGGNPNEHPEFVKILEKFSEANITPSYTTNGMNITPEILEATKEYCGAVAVSWPWWGKINRKRQALSTLYAFLEAGIQTNIHFILGNDSIIHAIDLLNRNPKGLGLSDLNAIVFLLHKPVGRAIDKGNLQIDDSTIDKFLDLALNKETGWGIGFDSCSVPLLVDRTNTDLDYTETCESARFSIFISHNLDVVPCSFMQHIEKMPNLKEQSLVSIWKEHDLFVAHRENMLDIADECNGCEKYEQCLGGCAYLPSIVMCRKKKK